MQNNQDTRNNNQTMTNTNLDNQTLPLFDYWLLNIGIYLVFVS